ATAAPHPLIDTRILRSARAKDAGPLTLVDLAMPRNVEPAIRALPWVRLIDLAGLRSDETAAAGDLSRDLAAAEEIIEAELQRYLRWLAGRSAADAMRRMRTGAETIARQEMARMALELPDETRASVERALIRTVHRLVHKPTVELRAAVQARNDDLVSVLASLFDPTPATSGRCGGPALSADQPDAAVRPLRPLLDVQRRNMRTAEQASNERGVHSAHKFTM